ncbi:YigZ family protein [Acetobacterium paludosum]|uniref:YigZ family protein n=1 Tax=Acetobacterium paludosum TaxID=52693 RepID=A0A923HV52_9FIRM|nr:YigZ family protein [Acetobacterium paludosum]MBC3889133.1 YigZ family protein [Acetobacterium paludosum]
MEDYKTVLISDETEIEIKKSRFINMVFHIENEEAVEATLTQIRKKHYKATHVCWAYVLNTNPKRQKSSDDGEPPGTAGKPILDIINHRELKDVLVVVVRYFGGIKLGGGGLIRAYGGGAGDVINHCSIIKKQYSDQLRIVIHYPAYGSLSNGLLEKGIMPASEDFGEEVTLGFHIAVAETKEFLARVEDQTNGNVQVIMGEPAYVDVPEIVI